MAQRAPRIEADLSDPALRRQIERLRTLTNMGNADLIRNAMLLMDWCADQVLEGRTIASIAEDGSVREFSMPALKTVRAHRRITLSAEAFDAVVELLERPAAPTDALRELLASNPEGG